jgi:hypothetical protein
MDAALRYGRLPMGATKSEQQTDAAVEAADTF